MNDLLEISVLPGKGRGYRAKQDIPAGATIHVSEPLATTVSQEWTPETCAYCFHFVYPKKQKIRSVTLQEQSLLLSKWNCSQKNGSMFKDMLFCSEECKSSAMKHGHLSSDWVLTLAVHYRLDFEFKNTQTNNPPTQIQDRVDRIEIKNDDSLMAWLNLAWDCLTENLDLHREIQDSDRSMCRLIAACILRKNSEMGANIQETCVTSAAKLPQYKDLLVIQNNELSFFKSLFKEPITKLPKRPSVSTIPDEMLDVMGLYSFFKRAMSQALYKVPELENVNHQVFRDIFFRERANSFGLWEMEDEEIAKGRGGVSDDLELLGFGIYPSAVYFNHSCDANVIKVRDGRTIKFVARRMISQNEEACISYGSVDEDVTARRQRLLEHYHFICQCTKCVQEHLHIINR